MPAQSTSAEKKHQAQQARRQAALNRASQRRRKSPKAPATAPATRSGTGASERPVAQAQKETTSSAPDQAQGSIFLSSEASAPEASNAGSTGSDNAATELEVLCELADTNPAALGPDLGSVRQLCRNRRKALSSRGKAAVPDKNSPSKQGGNAARAMAYAAGQISGRDLARLRRQEMAGKGRGDAPAARPSGRIRPTQAPPKVETGTTLSGRGVTGTQVERTLSVTGNESGTCRAITGTEYVGAEQFATFCGTQPKPNVPKVGISITGGGRAVSGTEVGRSEKVTGDEQGSCASVTGSEYIGADNLANFCGTKPSAKPAKVMSSRTERKDLRVTGADEARMNATTGTEAGAQQRVTGSQYADMGAAKMTINGPAKVALTHTIAGQSVTGTEVGRSAKVTGDEYGSCRPVTGTEYISNEQFVTVCGTIAEPHPAKVGVGNSLRGQRITGALVDRSEKVTGNEPGSCSRLTGTQYGESRLCGGAVPKVHNMHTLHGNHLTGNSIDLSPKMTGDEQGGCLPVTGTEYYGQEQFAQCSSTPPAAPAKVGVDHTPKGEHVQTPHHHGACCDSCAVRQAAEAAGLVAASAVAQPAHHHAPPAVVMPVQAQYQYPVQQAVPVAAPAAPRDFSIVSPARAAQVTGNSYGGSRVTGPGDLARNRVSGTPEFRYPEIRQMAAPAPAPMMAAPAPVAPPAAFAPAQPAAMHSQRITGEGREDGVSVTGDNWGRTPGMTGTEGHVAQGRNPSLRTGEMRPVNNAHHNKGMERPDVPAARVTGSSGNTHEGAVITVSGGARG